MGFEETLEQAGKRNAPNSRAILKAMIAPEEGRRSMVTRL